MTTRLTMPRVILAGWLIAWGLAATVGAEERSAAELLPSTTVTYVELAKPSELLETLLDHPVRDWLETQDNYRAALEQKEYLQFKSAVAFVEAQLGRSWRRILSTAAAGGIYLCVEHKTEGLAVLLKSGDDETPQQMVDAVLKIAGVAQGQGGANPAKIANHRDVKIYELGQAHLAVVSGHWLAVSNKGQLVRLLIDNALDKNDDVLSKQASFQEARKRFSSDLTAWGYLNLNAMRDAGIGRSLSRATADNPVGELLVGGTLNVLHQAPYVTAELQLQPDQLGLQVISPHDPEWVDERREYFFGPAGTGAAPPLLEVERTLLSVSTHRDVSQWWLRAGELFSEKINDGFAQADSNLSTLFSGKDFGADILGAVQPGIQLIVAQQIFTADTPQPAIKLPAFGLVFRLKEPQRMQSELRRTFQSLIGFLNITGAMNGQPQLDLDSEKQGDYQLVTSTYVPEADQDSTRLPINFNFSPTIGFAGPRFVVASTRQLARQLVRGAPVAADAESGRQNTTALAQAESLRAVLADNREHLIAQNMLEEGHTRAEAEREIKTLLELLDFVRHASLQLGTSEKTLRLAIELKLSSE